MEYCKCPVEGCGLKFITEEKLKEHDRRTHSFASQLGIDYRKCPVDGCEDVVYTDVGERRHLSQVHSYSNHATFVLNDGYESWSGSNYTEPYEHVFVHQLLACLNHDPHEVFAEGNVVHHGNDGHDYLPENDGHDYLPEAEHPRANWEGNLQVLSRVEHSKRHYSPQNKDDSGKFYTIK